MSLTHVSGTQHLLFSHVQLFATPWAVALQASLSFAPGVCSNSCPLCWRCHPTISSSVTPFSFCLQPFPAPGSTPVSQLFTSGGQSIGASAWASVNSQGWFPLGLTGLISLPSQGLSRFFSNTTIWNCQFFVSLLNSPTLTSINDYWQNHSFDYMDLCWQSNVSAF